MEASGCGVTSYRLLIPRILGFGDEGGSIEIGRPTPIFGGLIMVTMRCPYCSQSIPVANGYFEPHYILGSSQERCLGSDCDSSFFV